MSSSPQETSSKEKTITKKLKSKAFSTALSFISNVRDFKAQAKSASLKNEMATFLANFKDPFSQVERYEEEEILKAIDTIKKEELLRKRSKKKWKNEEKIILIWSAFYLLKFKNIENFLLLSEDNWKTIAEILRKTNYTDCIFKFNTLLLSNYKNKEWSKEEDQLLSEIVKEKYVKDPKIKWIEIAKEYYLRTKDRTVFRNEKICRERWVYFLDPKIKKTSWTNTEDSILLEEYLRQKTKWSKIAQKLPGRSCYSIKNRFDILLRKYDLQDKKVDLEIAIEKILRKARTPSDEIASNNTANTQKPENPSPNLFANMPPPEYFQTLFLQNMMNAQSFFGMLPYSYPPAFGFASWPQMNYFHQIP